MNEVKQALALENVYRVECRKRWGWWLPMLIGWFGLQQMAELTGRLLDAVSREFGLVGPVRWVDSITNLVTNVGLDDNLDKYLKGSAYNAAFFVGLTDGTPTAAAGDTMASHIGWVEVTAFTEANRPVLTLGAVSGQSVDNSASKASYSVNTNATTIGGAFLVTDNTKGGAIGTLYGVGAFQGGDKSADNGDTLNVTITCTAATA